MNLGKGLVGMGKSLTGQLDIRVIIEKGILGNAFIGLAYRQAHNHFHVWEGPM